MSSIIDTLKSFITVFILVSACLVVTQRKYIYFPRQYDNFGKVLMQKTTPIQYQINGKKQVAYFYGKSPTPKNVWIILSGNAALALHWVSLIEQIPDNDTGYLLIDYPGYGQNTGTPSQKNNYTGALYAYDAWLKTQPKAPNIFIMGHSLGSAVGIDLANKLHPKGLILLSPFTSMYHMSKRVIGSFWAFLLKPFLFDTYNSEAGLKKLQKNAPECRVLILHGNEDKVVPVSMGRQLANNSNQWAQYTEIDKANHELPYVAEKQLITIMQKTVQEESTR